MISCAQHDYIEIVCMYQYPVLLVLRNGAQLRGTALDTEYNARREECIKIKTDSVVDLVELSTVCSMRVTVNNPHVEFIEFT